ncbi:MlaD family protein [Bergeyella zoohelcum]|uniref:Virulence factor Mce family protein n=1 Tax=Bergeyella zoohelcum TaxID=1015 RepID=A0A376BZF8_9FLAO|nr:MlaD family protein [Bergeyella zoohelcum]EKB61039.1 hypothetical protein HMPREF9700_00534 [Bergeyella zoohelcum CCUG 30536]SSZ46869.1 virulence factor Mce family protein [Bergeyella zoohelcum]
MKISKELKAGVIAVLSIAAFVAMFQFMRGRNMFTRDNTYLVQYENVDGLKRSSEVQINGMKVGQVDEIIPKTEENGKIYFLVKLLVDPDFKFSTNSTVEITEPGFMSSKILKINAVYDDFVAQDGDMLKSSVKRSMLESLGGEVGPLSNQLKQVLKTVDSLGNNANKIFDDQNRREIAMLLTNLNQVAKALQTTAHQANALISSNHPKMNRVLDNADKVMLTTNAAVGKYGQLAESIDTQKLNETISSLDATIGKLNGVVSSIERGEGSLGKVMKDEQLYHNLQESTQSLNELLKDFKENPKRYVNISVFGKSGK